MDNSQENVQNEQTDSTEEQQQTAEPQANEAAEPEQKEAAPAEPSEEDKLKKQLAELNDKYLRTCAEYDNYRKRTTRERADLIKSAGSDIIVGLLPVIDDFDRALAHMTDDADAKAVKEGVELIYKKFNEFLGKRGVTVIETKDQAFDTEVHEAITMVPAPAPEMKGKIMDCVEKGYKLGDKVLRFAKVVVCQ